MILSQVPVSPVKKEGRRPPVGGEGHAAGELGCRLQAQPRHMTAQVVSSPLVSAIHQRQQRPGHRC